MSEQIQQRLFEAIQMNDHGGLEEAIAQGADLDDADTNEGLTPLILAVRAGHVDMIERLLGAGAELEKAGAQGVTPLHMAAMAGQLDAMVLLLEHGADPSHRAEMGGATVHLAAAAGNLAALEVLAEHGVDLLEEDASGLTAADYARAREFDEVASFLEDYRLLNLIAQFESLRESVAEVTRAIEEGRNTLEQRMADEADEEAQASELVALPSGGVPGEWDHTLMRMLADAREPIHQDEWEDIVAEHARFLASGGAEWPGIWNSLVQSDITFGLYDGPEAEEGAQADLHVRRLEGVNATGDDLRYAHLVGVVAPKVSFAGADLARAFATDCDLQGADFEGADLTRADFSRSDLRGANFRGADLSFTDFENCDMRGADFTGARLRGTKFPNANLEDATR